MTSIERAELLKLLAILCDRQLSESEHGRLEDILSNSAAARRVYLQYVDMHSRLLMHPGLAKGRRMPPGEAWARAALEEAVGLEGRAAAWNARRRSWWTWQRMAAYVSVAAATLAATLLLQLALYRPEPIATTPTSWPAEPPQYLATLAQTSGAKWDEQHAALIEGCRLLPGSLSLTRGVARIHFDSGVDLVVEGPAELRLESIKSAELLSGKVVFNAEAAAAPFSIRTPLSILTDIGTEYGVQVSRDREEVHVFAGEVQRERKSKAALGKAGASVQELVAAGEARWYAPGAKGGEPTTLAPERFVRDLPPSAMPVRDPREGLLAYEGFAYSSPSDFKDGKGTGGSGWNGAWEYVWANPPPNSKARWTLNVEEGLVWPNAQAAFVGGAFEYVGKAKYRRRLAEPLRLDTDGVYYLSFLFRRDGPSPGRGVQNLVGVQFRDNSDIKNSDIKPEKNRRGWSDPRRRLSVGVGRGNELFTHLERNGPCPAPLPLSYNEPYLLIAKIVASASNPDQVFVRVYGVEGQVSAEEPDFWSIAGPGNIKSDLVLEWLEIEIDSWRRQTLDELRLGRTWAAVAGPYVVVQPPALAPSK